MNGFKTNLSQYWQYISHAIAPVVKKTIEASREDQQLLFAWLSDKYHYGGNTVRISQRRKVFMCLRLVLFFVALLCCLCVAIIFISYFLSAVASVFRYSVSAVDDHEHLRAHWKLTTRCAAEKGSPSKYQFHDYTSEAGRPALCIVFPVTKKGWKQTTVLARNPVFHNTTSLKQETVESRKGFSKCNTERYIRGRLHYEDVAGKEALLPFQDSEALELQHVLDFLYKGSDWCSNTRE